MTEKSEESPSSGAADAGTIDVYWRPGCPSCMGLRRTLKRRDVEARWHNIWTDDEARCFVAEVNGGDETVPMVQMGKVTLTNPRWSDLSRVLAAVPGSDVEPVETRPLSMRVVSWLPVVGALGVGFTFDLAHETALSWAMDGLAVAAYFVTRPLRR